MHGIRLDSDGSNIGVVAVGDTFLFSPLTTHVISSSMSKKQVLSYSRQKLYLSPFVMDNCCLTHAIPYYRAFIGSGAEEDYVKLVHYCSKNTAA